MVRQCRSWRWARGAIVAFMPVAVVLGAIVLEGTRGEVRGAEQPPPKPPLPEHAVAQAALDKVADAYRGRYVAARTQARKTRLARDMIDAAGRETELPQRFALLYAAQVIAAGAGDLKTALSTVDETNRHFAIDAIALKVELVRGVARGKPIDVDDAIKLVLPLMDEAVVQNRPEHASALAEVVRAAAAGANDEKLAIEEAVVRLELLRQARAAAELSKATPGAGRDRLLQPDEKLLPAREPRIPVDPFKAMPEKIERVSIDVPREELLTSGADSGNPLSGRGKGKGQLVAAAGGTQASEQAVALALKWLSQHQMPDGGWSFNHALSPSCRGQCHNPGTSNEARNAATAMALLPFLGAGQTHKTGKYKTTVKAGFYFLVNRMKVDSKGGSLYERGRGSMYSQGLCSIALCEAYAMTHDKGLYGPSQQAVNFICYAQDPVGGGWRYQPRQKGDTSVFGWQLVALKSGHMAYLKVPPVTVKKAFGFLDAVQSAGGANYGYIDAGAGQATTAIGLLSRMYLGWKQDNPALSRGVKWLGKQGPSQGNMYYNYYATQVMRHYEGEEWTKWNRVMRDYLVKSQVKEGHEEGSWYFGRGDHGAQVGGRLYCTAMATMILEVYYRHLPIYRKQPAAEFPEDKPAEKPEAK